VAVADDEVTLWLGRLGQGDEAAAQAIWDRYYAGLVRLARQKLAGHPRPAAGEEDVAISAFRSFCHGVAEGRFPQLGDRNDLWRLLVTIAARKAAAEWKRHLAQRRGGGLVRGESAFQRCDKTPGPAGIDQVLGREPTPELAAAVSEQLARLLTILDDDSLRQIAVAKLEGYTNQEIARRLDCALATVERRLGRIRKIWSRSAQR
jgi:DNA-directed RNA polymerase specialized sigma24 family protein